MRKWIYYLFIGIFAVIFLISGLLLLDYYIKSNAAENTYHALSDMVQQAKPTQPEETLPSQEQTEDRYQHTHVRVTDPVAGDTLWLLPEYAELYTMNTDVVGWIQIPGTRVNYPVMQTPDSPDYYLHRDFYKEKSNDGSIYVREECDVFKPSDNVTIYGHRMNSGNMFADLLKYKEKDFWEENRYIRFDTLTQRNTYEIMAVFKISAMSDNGFQYHTYTDMHQERFTEFVSQCKNRSFYDTGITAQHGDKLITLSTCEKGNSNMRIVVVAKKCE